MLAEQAEPAEGGEQADPGDRRREDERQLDQRHDEVAEARRARRDPVRGRRAEDEDQHHRDRVRLERDEDRVDRGIGAERREEVARRHAQEDRRDRQQQERERDARREGERRPEERGALWLLVLGNGRKPAFLSAVWPLAPSSVRIHRCAAALLDERDTIAIS